MRIRRRYAILAVASVAALAVGGVAYGNHVSNVSSLPTWNVSPANLPNTNTFANAQLTVQTHTNYAHPGDKAQGGFTKTVTLHFDNDIKLNLAGVPSCTATFGSGTTIATAWERCGPGADTAPEVNAYLSPATGVSGTASTAPASNFPACTLVFKRGSSPDRILLFARVTLVPNGTANCSSPATNTSGNTSVTLVGTLGASGISADYGRKLTVPNIDQLALPLDDFKAKVKRASVFQGRCKDTNHVLNLRGIFAYSGTGQPADTVNKGFTCS
jgi:hypothetical protein